MPEAAPVVMLLADTEVVDTEVVGAELVDTEVVGAELVDTEVVGAELADGVVQLPAAVAEICTKTCLPYM